MTERIIYIQNPETSTITGHKVNIADLSDFSGGGKDPHFSWRDDEARAYILAKGIPAEDIEVPHHIYQHFEVRDPRISYTYSAAGAARALGISRQAFLERLENHPLEAKASHDGRPVYRWEDLVEWDAGIPKRGGSKKS